MAYFAQLDENNVVINVIVLNDSETSDFNGVELESIGVGFLQKTYGYDTKWKQTFMMEDGDPISRGIRGNYAGIGYTYMENVATLGVASTDVFIAQEQYASWSIGIQTAMWYPPIPVPGLTTSQYQAGYSYEWNEAAHQADNTVGWALTNV